MFQIGILGRNKVYILYYLWPVYTSLYMYSFIFVDVNVHMYKKFDLN
jgi:hypothetical protein